MKLLGYILGTRQQQQGKKKKKTQVCVGVCFLSQMQEDFEMITSLLAND